MEKFFSIGAFSGSTLLCLKIDLKIKLLYLLMVNSLFGLTYGQRPPGDVECAIFCGKDCSQFQNTDLYFDCMHANNTCGCRSESIVIPLIIVGVVTLIVLLVCIRRGCYCYSKSCRSGLSNESSSSTAPPVAFVGNQALPNPNLNATVNGFVPFNLRMNPDATVIEVPPYNTLQTKLSEEEPPSYEEVVQKTNSPDGDITAFR